MRALSSKGSIVVTLVVAVSLALAGTAAAEPRRGGLDLRLEHAPVIVNNAYVELPPIGGRGAMGSNIGSGGFSLAQQQLGDVYVRAGIVHDKSKLIRRGFEAFDFAFRRQRRNGSFPVDQTEEYAFFVEAVAHSVLLLKAAGLRDDFRGAVARYRRKLRRTLPHMTENVMVAAFKERNPRYTHSGYTVGAALTLSGRLLGKGRYVREGRGAIRTALDNQRRSGVNPELGGPDVRYQMVGLIYAERFQVYFPDGKLGRRVARMADRGLRWMDRKVDRDGYIDWRGSTRACHERASDGELKTPGYPFAVRGFAYWAAQQGPKRYSEMARDLDAYWDATSAEEQCGRKVEAYSGRRDDEARRSTRAERRGRVLEEALGSLRAQQLVP